MNIRHLSATLLLVTAGSTAQAASITLVPSAGSVVQNGTFTVNLVLSAADANPPSALAAHPGLHTGQIIVDFDKTLVAYNAAGFLLGPGVSLVPQNALPVLATNGNTQTLSLWYLNAPETGTVATLAFTAIGTPGGLANFGLSDALASGFGSFYNKAPTDKAYYPDIVGGQVNITAVPLPAGLWLLGTAVAALGARRRFREGFRRGFLHGAG